MCSPEHGKLCFEMLEMNSASQNNLPCGAGKRLQSRRFYNIYNWRKVTGSHFYFSHLDVLYKANPVNLLLPAGLAFLLP